MEKPKAALSIEKNCSTQEASAGETLTYSLCLINTGGAVLEQILLSDRLCPQMQFMPGSVRIDGVASPRDSPFVGIGCAALKPGECVSVQFDAGVLAAQPQEAEETCNIAAASCVYTDDDGRQKALCVQSGPCVVRLSNAVLQLQISCSESAGVTGDEPVFLVTLQNCGGTDLFHILLFHELGSCRLAEGTLAIDGQRINGAGLDQPLHIGILPRGQQAQVSYRLRLLPQSFSEGVFHCMVSARYSYNTSQGGVKTGQARPCRLSLTSGISVGNLILVNSIFNLPPESADFGSISSVGGQVRLLGQEMLSTPVGTAEGGQKLTGSAISLHAVMEFNVEYVGRGGDNAVESNNFITPVSTFLVLAGGEEKMALSQIKAVIDNISYNTVNDRSLFITASVFFTMGNE